MVTAEELDGVSTENLVDAYSQMEALSETLEVIYTTSDADSVERFLGEIGDSSNDIREILEERGVDVSALHRFAQEMDRPSESVPFPED